MKIWLVPLHYLVWHYTLALADLTAVLGNLLWYLYHFFSFSTLIRTLFSPWRRMGESYPHGFDPAGILSTFVVNMLMRLVGLLMRLIILIAGCLMMIVALVLAIIFFLIWLLLPVVVATLVVFSGLLLFTKS